MEYGALPADVDFNEIISRGRALACKQDLLRPYAVPRMRYQWSQLQRALRARHISSTPAGRAWIVIVALLLGGKRIIPSLGQLVLPVRLPHGRRILLADLSELRVLEEIFLDNIYGVPALPDSPRLILDLGANCGAASEFFAAQYPTSEIIAYEADPQVARRARRNLSGLAVDVRTAAISGSSDPVQLRRPIGMSWATSSYAREGEQFWVSGETLDSAIGDRHVDIMKIDIEGGEYAALSACSCLSQVDLILGEFHPVPGVAAQDFFGLLVDFDLLSGGGQERATFVARRRQHST